MFILKLVRKLLKALRSDSSPKQLAWGFAMGLILGLTPFWNIHNAVILILIIILHVNIGTAILSFLVFSGFAYLFDPIFHSLGYYLLTQVGFFNNIWRSFYNNPVIVFTRYNNTVVLGSLLSALVLFIPVYFSFKKFVYFYRDKLEPKIQKWKIVKIIKGTKFYKILSSGYKLKNIGE